MLTVHRPSTAQCRMLHIPDATHVEVRDFNNLGEGIDAGGMHWRQLLLRCGAQGPDKLHNCLAVQAITAAVTGTLQPAAVGVWPSKFEAKLHLL